MKGSFKLIDCRTLTAKGRQGCGVISLDCSPEFLDWLAKKPKNYRFGYLYSYLYINGGKRSDSITQYNTPALSPEASSSIHQWKGGEVMKTAFATSTRLESATYTEVKLKLNCTVYCLTCKQIVYASTYVIL